MHEFSIGRWKCVFIFPFEGISKTARLVSSLLDRIPPIQVWNVRTLNGSLHFKSICLHNFAEERTGIHVRVCMYGQGGWSTGGV